MHAEADPGFAKGRTIASGECKPVMGYRLSDADNYTQFSVTLQVNLGFQLLLDLSAPSVS